LQKWLDPTKSNALVTYCTENEETPQRKRARPVKSCQN